MTDEGRDSGSPPASARKRSSLAGPEAGDTPGTPPKVGCMTPITLAIVGGLVLTAMLSGLLLGRCSAPDAPPPAATVTTVRPSPSVITAIRDLARLETAEYHIERVVDLTETQKRFFGLVEVQDAILLVAAGDVTAGVDLAELRDHEVVVDQKTSTVEITLPPAKILNTRLDTERTYVHTRKTDTLARRRESLETEARKHAEKTLAQAATEGEILQRADKNAQKAIESLARSFGYQNVRVKRRGPFQEKTQ
jgi:hypothetical protein